VKKIKGGVTAPQGFLAGSAHCGIKRSKKDLCLIFSRVPCRAAGVFTSNRVKAAPLLVCEKNLKNAAAQAIIANSGNANCMTGRAGLNDALKVTKSAAAALSIKPESVLPASTGVIGKRLPVGRIVSFIPKLVLSLGRDGSAETAKAIMTTDTIAKQTAVSVTIGRRTVKIGAMAKGAGMIHPGMATMLAFITTDAAIRAGALKKALKESVDATFNRITVDGDMSTNDCALILSNGGAGNSAIGASGRHYEIFRNALTAVCLEMAEKIVRDAEGATKFVRVSVKKAANAADAAKAAYAIATSVLVKTALYGGDPNWGRIAAAVGRSGASFSPGKLDIYLGGKKFLSGGTAVKTVAKKLRDGEIEIRVVLNKGRAQASVLTSDLSKEYVDINAHYTT